MSGLSEEKRWMLLETLVAGNRMKKFTKEDKDTYRLHIAYTMATAWFKHFNLFDEAFTELMLMNSEQISTTKFRLNKPHIINEHERKCKLLDELGFKFVIIKNGVCTTDTNLLVEYINFIRVFLQKYNNNNQRLFLYKDFTPFWDLSKIYKKTKALRNLKLLEVHWIDFTLLKYQMPIYIYPDFSAYQDMINLWNNSVEKYNELQESDIQSVGNALASNLKYSLIAGVHFVETYLSYYYYLCKAQGMFKDNSLHSIGVRNISDEMIVEKLIYSEFSNAEENINYLYTEYKKINTLRNALVHYTAFEESETTQTRLQTLINIGFIEEVADYLTTCWNFVVATEEIIESDILFWKQDIEQPNFKGLIKILNVLH